MEVFISFSEQPDMMENLHIEKKIAEGRSEVYCVFSPAHQSSYALKCFPKDEIGTNKYQNEKLMYHLNHPNVIQNVPIISKDQRFHMLLIEFAKHGDFFELASRGVLDDEIIVRTYFHQLIEGIEYVHSSGLAHLDLKLENVMLGADYLLKIIDFDQAQPITEKRIYANGTPNYRAPEILDRSCQDLAAADIYSAGVILFTFMTKTFPVDEKKDEQGIYLQPVAAIVKEKNKFWNIKRDKKQEKSSLSKDFLKLVRGMLHFDPEKRWKIRDIKNSVWYKGPVMDQESLRNFMEAKVQSIKCNNFK